MQSHHFGSGPDVPFIFGFAASRSALFAVAALVCFLSLPVHAQQTDTKSPVIVQPGAPGQPTRALPASTRAILPPRSKKDVEFMQGMIMHHAQAVEMTAMIEDRTQNKSIRLIGARISQSQSDEMNFMKRWLELRGEPIEMSMEGMHTEKASAAPSHADADPKKHSDHADQKHAPGHQMLMPGMLTTEQMEALKKARGAEFDRLFLKGMIQHHNGALVMVKDLFDSAGAGQDAELFNFASDVDSGQRAEIRSMQTLLDKNP